LKKSDRRSLENVMVRRMAQTAVVQREIAQQEARSEIPMSGIKSDAGFVLSEREAALLEEDVVGRVGQARSARLLAGVMLRTEAPQWSRELVKERLKEAARGIERYVTKAAPSRKSGFWPDPFLYAGASMADRNTIYEGERDGTRGPSRSALNYGGLSAGEIARAEQAILWPSRYLSDPEHEHPRMALRCWAWCEAYRVNFQDQCAELGCSRMTAYRRLNAAFDVILAGVKMDGISP
jgi:hypothetical protein